MPALICLVTVVSLTRFLKSDVSLLRAYAGGDTVAFETLYNRHKDGLFNFIFRSVSRQAVAEEIAQDVWLSVIKTSSAYQPGAATFRTWLYIIDRNKTVDYFRRAANQHQPGEETDAQLGGGQQHPFTAEQSHESDSDVEKNLLLNQLLEALEALPAEQREAFMLQQEGFTAKEISDITGASKEAVKSRLRYAKSTTRAQLEVGG